MMITSIIKINDLKSIWPSTDSLSFSHKDFTTTFQSHPHDC